MAVMGVLTTEWKAAMKSFWLCGVSSILANLGLYAAAIAVKTAAQCTNLIVGLDLGTFSILPGSNLLSLADCRVVSGRVTRG